MPPTFACSLLEAAFEADEPAEVAADAPQVLDPGQTPATASTH